MMFGIRIQLGLMVLGDYFGKLFQSTNPNQSDIDRVLSCVKPQLSESKSAFLDACFTSEAIRVVLFDMFPTKAPGSDGLPTPFYKKLWEVVGDKVESACLGVLNNGDGLNEVNETIITHITKVKGAEKMIYFSPISLCNVVYNIVVKALANRFRKVLGDVILETQSAFILGWLISDNAKVGFECMYALKRGQNGLKGAIAFKLDMFKAYDMVKWSFLV
ncbi:hypothetical protein Dsin_016943 [Dipteronia sinensis]|uniref:Reverse transcriptase n=1 Tax=Dipteronia sinensis TaxID=43782 RepID=A0AAE0AFF0_9ROSI|nr:hypothetical protein Dsin_016943 [Dipteronia sinensis]